MDSRARIISATQGVVSAAPKQLPVYLIDGNISPGVSGGPLWFCAPSGSPIVVGVVVNYSRDNRDTPGLLGATPLHIFLDPLRGEITTVLSGSVHIEEGRSTVWFGLESAARLVVSCRVPIRVRSLSRR
jgi:hypothetical protein